ncbi:MAG: AGE family epimerase/isomerase [Myxococcales bacterium]|nr:AGE family epimerase/isomerase [Myxococcales bacterium]
MPGSARADAARRPARAFFPLALLAALALFAGCDDGPAATPDAAAPDAAALDAATPDAALPDAAAHPPWTPAPPPSREIPEALRGDTWVAHYRDDILPYWSTPDALGEPPGNFPTERDMNGDARPNRERRPRMLGRQIYTYAMGYALTGDVELLRRARAGVDWLLTHARDPRGGFHPLLTADGRPVGGAKTAQDLSYAAMGLAAWYFVTRDPAAEAELLALRDLLFDPNGFYDEDNQRIRDGMSADLGEAFDVEGDGGWELVAQLDPINAFLLLVQPVLSDAGRRAQVLDDLRTLTDTLIARFWSDGIFWGVHDRQGAYGTRHVDFGHTLKSYWMVFQVDKRLPGAPYRPFVEAHAAAWVERAYDDEYGRWAKRPTGATGEEYGSDWWIYAEADQLAAALDMVDPRFVDTLAATAGNWLRDYVDPLPPHGIIPGVRRDGSPAYGWPRSDTAKCNQWKNGYHATEHALILYLHGRDLEDRPATLHFAVAPAAVEGFVARPYLFEGTEIDRRPGDRIDVGGLSLQTVAVDFVDIH